MNRVRRQALANCKAKLAELMEDLMVIAEAEDEVIESLPESIRYSERWEDAENDLAELNDAIDALDDICDILDAIVEV